LEGLIALFPLGDAKIDDLDKAVSREHQVLGFKIPMNQMQRLLVEGCGVGVMEALEKLRCDRKRYRPRDRCFASFSMFVQQIKKVQSFDDLHLKAKQSVLFVFKCVVDTHKVLRVTQTLAESGFFTKGKQTQLEDVDVGGGVKAHDLERDLHLKAEGFGDLDRTPDLRLSAASE